MEISPGVHLVPGLTMGNACLVTEPETLLFDTGLPGDGPAILHYLEAIGLQGRDLQHIVLTHSDSGHSGAAAWLRRNTAARLLASDQAAAVLEGRVAVGNLRTLWHFGLRAAGRAPERCAVDAVIAAGDDIGGFEVLETPGHTAGHLAFFRESDGLLIAGDSVRVAGTDILAPSFWNSESEVRARISISRLAELPVKLLVPGHGPPYREPGPGLRRAGGPPGAIEEALRKRAAHQARRHAARHKAR